MNKTALLCALAFVLPLGCRSEDPQTETSPDDPPKVTNRIPIPDTVRQNLGITFAEVERRHVARTIRVPGRFELRPESKREYHAALGGRVDIKVRQYQPVTKGTVLYSLDSPGWRQLQHELAAHESAEAIAAAQVAAARRMWREASRLGKLAASDPRPPQKPETKAGLNRPISNPRIIAAQSHIRSQQKAVSLWQTRLSQLEELNRAGGGRATDLAAARAEFEKARAELASTLEEHAEFTLKLEAEIKVKEAEHQAARSKRLIDLTRVSTLLQIPREKLTENVGTPEAPIYRWQTIGLFNVEAEADGVVESLGVAQGGWVDEMGLVLTTVDPKVIRFRAIALQSDLGEIRDGLPASIVPPEGGSLPFQDRMSAKLRIGLEADPDRRTVELIAEPSQLSTWARQGVSGFLEIVLEETGEPELAIPASSVVQDELDKIFFRRDPNDRNQVIRVEADLGVSDGRWIVVKSGVMAGDEIVLGGVYELKLTGGGKAPEGGHFHADGTFHAGDKH